MDAVKMVASRRPRSDIGERLLQSHPSPRLSENGWLPDRWPEGECTAQDRSLDARLNDLA
ncbi:hypothetical protein FRAHR75_150005 [Frankia sp. Hr75.2]|nr:hypothetical protein FRAHR75_150005 [Frankia sp. Hr75.2]